MSTDDTPDRPTLEELEAVCRWLWLEGPNIGHALTLAPDEIRHSFLAALDEPKIPPVLSEAEAPRDLSLLERIRLAAQARAEELEADDETETLEVWLLYPRGTYSGSGAEVHTTETLAQRLLEKDVLSHGDEWIPILERWSYTTDEDGLSEWSLDETSDK